MKTKLKAPDWLTDRAKEVFHETVETLGDKVLPSDVSVIADFAQCQADCEEWVVRVRFEGEVLRSHTGNPYANPTYTLLMSRRKDLERYRDDLGLTPQCRRTVVKKSSEGGLKDLMKR